MTIRSRLHTSAMRWPALPGGDSERPPSGATPISAVMTRNARTVEPGLSIEALTYYLLQHGVTAAAVTKRGRLVGIVSMTDLVRTMHDRGDDAEPSSPALPGGFHMTQLASATVAEIMTPCVFALPDTASVQQAAALMEYERVHQLPVLGPRGRVVGMLSSLAVMGWLARQSTTTPRQPRVTDEWGREPPVEVPANDRPSHIRLSPQGRAARSIGDE